MEQRAQGEYRAFGQLGHRRDDRRARLYRAARRSRSAKLSRHRDLAGPQPDRGTQRRLRPVALRRQRRAAPDSRQGCFDRRSRSMTAHPPLRTPMRLRAPRGFTLIGLMVGITLGLIVLAVRRTGTCIAGDTNCDAAATGQIYLQSTLCNDELANPAISAHYIVAAKPASGPSAFPLHKHDCATLASLRSYVMHIYFIANNNNTGDGVPTLKR